MPDKPNNIVRVAIQRPLYKLLDYSCDLSEMPAIGSRVKVFLGNAAITAIVVDVNVESEFSKLKPVVEILDKTPLLDESLLGLLKWASSYYFYPLGEVLFHALPVSLRKDKAIPKLPLWSPSESALSLPESDLKRAPKQQDLLSFLIDQGEADAIQLQQHCGDNWRNSLRALIKKGLIKEREVDADYLPQKLKDIPTKDSLELTEEQQECVRSIVSYFNQETLQTVLLHGITGSGKTEVYLRSIDSLLKADKQVLVLVPEIGLTPQLLFRFQQHFPQYTIASLHSALSDSDRMKVWLGARSGAIQVVIGTRSAVFTPMKNLGAILIDEEHDASFKQQEGFLYQGRDMAIKRAHDMGVPVLLGSATPSLETLHNVNKKRFHYLRLNSRPGVSKPPTMSLQDIRALPLEAGVSSLMMAEIKKHIENNNQVMLFLNRRGFSPVLMCPDCGWHANCKNCDMGMTYHAAARKIICHHCGLEEPVTPHCPDCNGDRLTTQGQGTERIEAVLNTHFPDVPVIRIDRDSTSRKGSLEAKLDQVHKGEPVILIGTQMLTKGHDFPKLTLVGILDVDQALFSVDYRAQERLAQQVMQVAGRAGRGKEKGRVVLQTSQPQHPLLLGLLSEGYTKTATQILNERALWNYPPMGTQALIKVNASNSDIAFNFINQLSEQLFVYQGQNSTTSVDILGPMPSPIARRANRYRFQLLLAAKQRGELHGFLVTALSILSQLRKNGGLRWVIDVDPVDFL